MKTLRNSIVICFAAFLMQCAGTRGASSHIIGVRYDKIKNVTNYFSIPEGNVEIPGKWGGGQFNQSSRQQLLYQNDTTRILIGLTNILKYPFYSDSLDEMSFTKAFYKWDSDYFKNDQKLNTTLLEMNSNEGYLMYYVELGDVENIMLLFTKGKILNSYTYFNKKGRDKSEAISLLKEIYKRNKK